MAERLNVLFIMADQLTVSALSCYGNRICKAPHIDALASRGALFEAHYCNFPLCAPSRASMLTGRLATRVGAYDNAADFPTHAPTIPYYLAALGYHTCLSGKMHFIGPDQLHGYQERLTTDVYPSDYGWTATDNTRLQTSKSNIANILSAVREAGTCRRSLQLDYDDEVCTEAEQWIYDYRRRASDKPFFLTVSLTHPHPPYVTTERHWNRYEGVRIDMPRVGPMAPDRLDPLSQRSWKALNYDKHDLKPEHVLSARRAYYGNISYVDDQIGRLLEALREMDLEESTAVIFTSDHGDMLGERGLWFKRLTYEPAMRIPLIVAIPGARSCRVPQPTSLLDLLPTLLDIATGPGNRIEPVSEIEGVSLLPAMLGRKALPADRPFFAEMTADHTIDPCFIVRKGDWKYVACEGDPPQLYNLEQDPDELANLAGSPRVAEIERELAGLLETNWSAADIKREMVRSAQQRLFIHETRAAAGGPAWDYEPRKDASKRFVRGDISAAKGRARYPHVKQMRLPTPNDKQVG